MPQPAPTKNTGNRSANGQRPPSQSQRVADGQPGRATKARLAAQRKQQRNSSRLMVAAAIVVLAVAVGFVLTSMFAKSSSSGPGVNRAIATIKAADFHTLAFKPDDPNVVFFGHHNGVMRSNDGGATWSNLVAQTNFDAMGMAISPNNPNQIYIAGHYIFQASSDGGNSWHSLGNTLPGGDIHGFAMNPTDANLLSAFVVGYGLFHSSDAGKTWVAAGGQIPGDVMTLASGGGSPETLYAGSMSSGTLQSSDGGQSWSPMTGAAAGAMTVVADPTARQTLYAGASDGIYKSTDGGASWNHLPLTASNVMLLAVSPAKPQRLLAISVDSSGTGLVYRSDDGGQTWGGR
jgi:photosystem II stability/assembly factor-like uncharacterized protein